MSTSPQTTPEKPKKHKRVPNRHACHGFLYRMTFGQQRRFLTLVWAFQQRPDHQDMPWTRKRVLDLAVQHLIEKIEAHYPGKEMPEIPDAVLEKLE